MSLDDPLRRITGGDNSPKSSGNTTRSTTPSTPGPGVVLTKLSSPHTEYELFPYSSSAVPLNFSDFKLQAKNKNKNLCLHIFDQLLEKDQIAAANYIFTKKYLIDELIEKLQKGSDTDLKTAVLEGAFSCLRISNSTLKYLAEKFSISETEKFNLSKKRALAGNSELLHQWSTQEQRKDWYREFIDQNKFNELSSSVNELSRSEIFSVLVEKEQWEKASELIIRKENFFSCSASARSEWYQHLIDNKEMEKLISYVNNHTRSEIFSALMEKEKWEEASQISTAKFHLWASPLQRNAWYRKLIESKNIPLLRVNLNEHTRFEIFSALLEGKKSDEACSLIPDRKEFLTWCPDQSQRISLYEQLVEKGQVSELLSFLNPSTKKEIFCVLVGCEDYDLAFGLMSEPDLEFLKASDTPVDPARQVSIANNPYISFAETKAINGEGSYLSYSDAIKKLCTYYIDSIAQSSMATDLSSSSEVLDAVKSPKEDLKVIDDSKGKLSYLWRNILNAPLQGQLFRIITEKLGKEFLENLNNPAY